MDCEKMCKIKRVRALRGRWRVDYEKMCKIKRVRALRGAGEIAKKCAKLRGLGH